MRCHNCEQEMDLAQFQSHKEKGVKAFYDLWKVPGTTGLVKVYKGQQEPTTPGARWTVRGAFTVVCPEVEPPTIRAQVFRFPARKEGPVGRRYGFIVKKGSVLLSSGSGLFEVCIAIAHAEVGRFRYAEEPPEVMPVPLPTGEWLTYRVEDRQVQRVLTHQ